MTHRYREPDPWVLEHRIMIQIISLLLGATGLIALIKAEYPVNLMGTLLSFTTVMGYGWLQRKWRPSTIDFLEYLEAQAKQDNLDPWLRDKTNMFKQVWCLDKPLREALHE